MKVSNNFSVPNFKAIYMSDAAADIMVKKASYVGTKEAFDAARANLSKAAGEANNFYIDSYGDNGVAVWKCDVHSELGIFNKTDLVAKNEHCIDALNIAAVKLEREKEQSAPKQIRQRFPGNASVRKFDETI